MFFWKASSRLALFLVPVLLAACGARELEPVVTSEPLSGTSQLDQTIVATPTLTAENVSPTKMPTVTVPPIQSTSATDPILTEPSSTPTVSVPTTVPTTIPPTPVPTTEVLAPGPEREPALAILVRPEGWRPWLGDIAIQTVIPGADPIQLTTYRYNADPILSPDRNRIAYRSVPNTITGLAEPGPRLHEGLYNIWVITADGQQAWQLTSSEAVRSIPSWSADSSRVIFSQGAEGQLVEVEVDTQASNVLTGGAFNPKYRPDGKGIGFITADAGLAWLNSVGTFQEIIPASSLPPNSIIQDFDWTPDGQHIVYTLADETDRVFESTLGILYSVWIVGIDGSPPEKLAEGGRNVTVSPDGQTVGMLTGSGYGDACMVDQQMRFLRIGPDMQPAEVVDITNLNGYPNFTQGETLYPLAAAKWISGDLAFAEFDLTCAVDRQAAGSYFLDLTARQMVQLSNPDNSSQNTETISASPTPDLAIRETGIAELDTLINIMLSNNIKSRSERIQYLTVGCTTIEGLGGPPKCDETQSEGDPITYFPLLGPGHGQPVLPEAIDGAIDFQVDELFAAYRTDADVNLDEYYPGGEYNLIFKTVGNEPINAVSVRTNAKGGIVRIDFLVGSPMDAINRDAAEVLVTPLE